MTTHLNTVPSVQLAQMQELISAESGVLPIVMGGDFNANADDPLDPTYATYQAAINAGFADAWTAAHSGDPGYTCCQDQDLLNFPSALDQRVDLELLRGAIGVDGADLLADNAGDRTPFGLWPSDHAGLITTLEIPRGSLVIPETSTWVMMAIGFAGLGFAGYRQRRTLRGAASV